jgi:peroxiredoxin
VRLQQLLSDQEKATTEIVALSVDPRADLQKIADKVLAKAPGKLQMTLLSDPDHAVIARYGLLNEAAAQKGRFLPHPTTYVIDRQGIVRWKFTEVDYKIRPANEMILDALRAAK